MPTAKTEFVSADSHVTEPWDLWEQRIASAYKSRAPRYVHDRTDGGLFFEVDGQRRNQVNVNIAVGQRPEDYEEFFKLGLDSARPGGWDPAERLKDMNTDGIHSSVLYTSQGFGLFSLTDAGYQRACFEAYNDWLAEHCSYAPNRLIGIAMISLYDIDHAITELHRCRDLGLRGAMIWGTPPEERPFDSERYEPFWSTADELGMPLSLHIATGGNKAAREKASSDAPYWQDMHALVSLPSEVQCSLTTLIFSGVMERHPGLKFISAEYDMGWVPYYLQYADRLFKRWSPMLGLDLPMTPSEYFQRQVRLTFIREPVGLQMVAAGILSSEIVMWCDDYPHGASTWPHSRDVIRETMSGVNEQDRHKITRDNAASLYQIDLSG